MTTELTVATIGAAAVIIAALIGFIVAVSSAVIAKEQKISEFRQEWINELRKDVASAIQLSYNCLYESQNAKNEDVIHRYNLIFRDVELKFILIKLKLNPNEDEFISTIDSLLYNFGELVKQTSMNTIINIQNDAKKIEHLCHATLKNEWERVKKGERKFVVFRSFGEVFLFAFITAFFVALAFIKIPELAHLLK